MDAVMLEIAEEQAAHCRAMGNARRLVILWMLAEQELSVTEIAQRAGSSIQNVSQHLNLLKKAGIVTTRRDGQTIFYHLADHEWVKRCPALRWPPRTLK